MRLVRKVKVRTPMSVRENEKRSGTSLFLKCLLRALHLPTKAQAIVSMWRCGYLGLKMETTTFMPLFCSFCRERQ